ncbi:hypothetical protein BJX66DRAFT_231264 [Aspergillus keveii]|uniref:Uncharacterized protein n=1 Tax=Aspergillus keveii TaxID=714993 RepID=A0ABR4G2L0_9EURO
MIQAQGFLRRRRQHPAALRNETQQSSEQEIVSSDKPLQKSVLRNIAYILLVLDVVSLRILSDLGKPSDILQYRPLIENDPVSSQLFELALTCCYEDQVETFRFRRYLERLSREELITRITQLQNGVLHKRLRLAKIWSNGGSQGLARCPRGHCEGLRVIHSWP